MVPALNDRTEVSTGERSGGWSGANTRGVVAVHGLTPARESLQERELSEERGQSLGLTKAPHWLPMKVTSTRVRASVPLLCLRGRGGTDQEKDL